MYLDPGMLLVVLSPVEPHAPHHFEPVLHQHLDESKLVKVQQVHQVCLDLRVWLGALQTRQLLSMQLQVNGLHSDNKAKASNGIMLTSNLQLCTYGYVSEHTCSALSCFSSSGNAWLLVNQEPPPVNSCRTPPEEH